MIFCLILVASSSVQVKILCQVDAQILLKVLHGGNFYEYSTLYDPGPSSHSAQDLQEFLSSLPGSSESSQQLQSPGGGIKD